MTTARTLARLTWSLPPGVPEATAQALMGPGAPFEMREEDVLGTRLPVFARRPRSLWDLLAGAAERFPDRPYLVFPDSSYTFREILTPIAAAARVLRDDYGVGKGDRVAIASANCAEYVFATWAAVALGAVTVALNGWWTAPELAYGITLSDPKVVLADARRLERLAAAPDPVTPPVVPLEGDWWRGGLATGPAGEVPVTPVDEDDPYLILFTSGTTGRPKGALLSHRGNIHFILASLLSGALNSAATPAPAGAGDAPPCVLGASPMFHIAGMNSQIVMAPVTGMTIVYPPQGRWQESVHLQLSQDFRVSNWSLVPAQLWRLVDWPDLGAYDLSALRSIGGGSAVWPPELLRRAREVLPQAVVRLGYGMTETNGLGTSLGPPQTSTHPESVGRPSPSVEVEVRDPGTGEAVEEGETGEVCLRTAAALLGYWRNPEATAAALDADRWYRTGDFGHVRDGLLFLEGRRHDLIIRGGENIYPAEIENRLVEHPAVAEVAVVGVDHPTLGQEVKAFVVPAAGQPLTEQDVRAWVGESLAAFKVPAHVAFVDALPRNAMGKVLRAQLLDPATPASFVPE